VLIEAHAAEATIACIGDSAAAVLSVSVTDGALTGRMLTSSHKPDKPEERQRIVSSGVYILYVAFDTTLGLF
jgi:hypothetical protein